MLHGIPDRRNRSGKHYLAKKLSYEVINHILIYFFCVHPYSLFIFLSLSTFELTYSFSLLITTYYLHKHLFSYSKVFGNKKIFKKNIHTVKNIKNSAAAAGRGPSYR